ncbi:hypothetical protein SAMN05216359_101154 [Roseateles sp. YR242]|uniref:hypothetical protein n=1 Tax=Roseateles sp. YR242 TaxID=1855305 RepID=UPI0008AF98D3|nr:hypothetical protein [Roseateles sp. YR242]SEK24439.1 hypothetical protein SAMN05216359_101154 [Roseateles sp. YR242]
MTVYSSGRRQGSDGSAIELQRTNSHLTAPEAGGSSGSTSLPTTALGGGLAARGGAAAAQQPRRPGSPGGPARAAVPTPTLTPTLTPTTTPTLTAGVATAHDPVAPPPALLRDSATAQTQAHAAHAAVPQWVDREAAARAARGQGQTAAQDMTQRQTRAETQATAEAQRRDAVLNTAEQAFQSAEATVLARQLDVDTHRGDLQTETARHGVLHQAHEDLRTAPAFLDATAGVEQATARLQMAQQRQQAASSSGTAGGSAAGTAAGAATGTAASTGSAAASASTATPPSLTPEQEVDHAKDDLTRRQGVLRPLADGVERARVALADCADRRDGIQERLHTAQGRLGEAETLRNRAQTARDDARIPVTALANAQQTLTQVVASETPHVTAHDTAAGTAVDLAAAATRARRALADGSSLVADTARAAEAAGAALAAHVPVLDAAVRAHEAAQAPLQAGGALHQRRIDCQEAVAAAEQAVHAETAAAASSASSGGASASASASAAATTPATRTPAQQRLHAANQDLDQANAAIRAQEGRVGPLAAAAAGEAHAHQMLQGTAHDTAVAANQAEAARLQLAQAADHADQAAANSIPGRTSAQGAAATALSAIEKAVEDLCQAIRPDTAAPGAAAGGGPGGPGAAAADERTTGQRAKDLLLRRPLHALQNRTGPAKLDITVGPYSGARSNNTSTGFHSGLPPVKTPHTGTSASSLRAVDGKVNTAATQAARLLAGGAVNAGQAAQAPQAFGNAVAFSAEVGRMFGAAAGAAAPDPVATALANALLNHPNPDPAGRPDGHPLRHEQALLVATVLRSVTSDPATAAQIYNTLWNNPAATPGGVTQRAPQASPLAGVASTPQPDDVALAALTNSARRALAATSGGMAALLQIEGLSLPAADHADRRHAEHTVEHYKLGLRAETALFKLLPDLATAVGPRQSTQEIRTALENHADHDRLSDPAGLGRGNRNGDREHAATLAAQAFLYAADNVQRLPGSPEQVRGLKPAYVALRNGFTESGQGSEFNLMTKRLRKFVKYIDLACASKVAGHGVLSSVVHPRRTFRRGIGKDKTPLKTLIQAGPLGSDLSTVPGEHAKRLRSALQDGSVLLRNQLRAVGGNSAGAAGANANANANGNAATATAAAAATTADPAAPAGGPTAGDAAAHAHATTMSNEDRTRGLMRLAAMDVWRNLVPEKPGPLQDLTQGTRLTEAAIRARAHELNAEIFGDNNTQPPPLHQGVANAEVESQVSRPLLPGTLHEWFGDGRLADSTHKANTPALDKLNADVNILRGKAAVDSQLEKLQADFDKSDVAGRREILRQVMISVVAGGDMTDYSDGRKNGIGGAFGFMAAQVNGVGVQATGVTPMAEFNLDHTRTAVLKAGVASNTGVIFLGNERKVTEMLGGGVRFGAQVPGANVSAQVMARLGGSHLYSKGLMIRTDKHGSEHQQLNAEQTRRMESENWKRMSELVVNSVFEIADQMTPAQAARAARTAAPTAGAQAAPPVRPEHGGEMWSQMVEKVGDYRDISFGWNTGEAHQVSLSLSVEGNASIKLDPKGVGGRASIAASAGIKHTPFNRSKASESKGSTQTTQAASGSRTSLTAGVSAGYSHPTISNEGKPTMAVLSRHKVGVETELVIQAKNGTVRLTTMDGKVQPNVSFKHREFAVEDDFVKLVNSQRDQWEPRLGERRADGVLTGGHEALNGFLQQMVNLPPGNSRLFIERKCLTQEAADTLTACTNRLEALERPGAPTGPAAADQIAELRDQIAAHVSQESSWQPFRLFVNQAQQRSRESGLGGDARASNRTPDDPHAAPSGLAERFVGGGKVTLGGKVNTAHGGRDLITLDALPVRP